jgi:hypothetical protein
MPEHLHFSPAHLLHLQFRGREELLFAGQITGSKAIWAISLRPAGRLERCTQV